VLQILLRVLNFSPKAVPARPAPSAWCARCSTGPRPVGAASPWHRSAPDCCKTYAEHSSIHPASSDRHEVEHLRTSRIPSPPRR